ncbi:uncharacterized protein LOC115472554 [Microcaecilia unicolor]|uniref:Uncharacterized protein LOC115472554 n=1 Tax=Microcaecilia unicolor TaxID=1415580 RepID=A0A6P7YCP8_9AMPH|nr:uncharacterized protein LOC115472554 [Microcaecilia unicolor]
MPKRRGRQRASPMTPVLPMVGKLDRFFALGVLSGNSSLPESLGRGLPFSRLEAETSLNPETRNPPPMQSEAPTSDQETPDVQKSTGSPGTCADSSLEMPASPAVVMAGEGGEKVPGENLVTLERQLTMASTSETGLQIHPMASLCCVVHCFLLMFITSSVSQRSKDFNCPSLVNVKVGDSVQLICYASDDIWNVIVYDPLNGNEKIIDTYESKTVSADKRITLEIGKASPPYMSSAALNIRNVNISDAGTYIVFLHADGSFKQLGIELRVEVPYSNISMTQNQSAVFCEAQGGSVEGQIHWFDGHQRNWTKSAEMISNKMENGRFMLTSVLHLKPFSIMEKYCCTVEYRLMGNTEEMSSCISTNEKHQEYYRNYVVSDMKFL